MERLYYTDSLLTRFDANVVEGGEQEGRPYVILDRTAFYPSSGGQPHDVGRLETALVLDVIERETDGAIQHVLDRPLPPGSRVWGEIDWPRRRDHMQQHTGQHVLSAAFDRLFGIATLSFHLGRDLSTIDLDAAVDAGAIARSEALANEVVWDDRPVTVRFVSPEEAAGLPLRKDPSRSGSLRVIEIPEFDLSACGGTHVPTTGAIGSLAAIGWERHKGGTRVSFVCGSRALRQYQAWRDVVLGCARRLSLLWSDLPEAVTRLQDEQRQLRQQVRRLEDERLFHHAGSLASRAVEAGAVRLVSVVLEQQDARELKALAQAVVTRAGFAAALATRQRPVLLVLARAGDVELDMGRIIRLLLDRFGGRGGGRPEFAQAGGFDADPDTILETAVEAIAAADGASERSGQAH